MSDPRTIKIFSSVGMPEKAGKEFLGLLFYKDVDIITYKVGELAEDVDDEDSLEGLAELDGWLEEQGALPGETVALYHGHINWEDVS